MDWREFDTTSYNTPEVVDIDIENNYNSNSNIFIPKPTSSTQDPPLFVNPFKNSSLEDCLNFDFNYDPVICFCSTALFVFGALFCFFGYRLYKTCLFLTGLIFGLVIVLLICQEEDLMPNYGNVGISLLSGILYGLICYLVPYVGFFTLGFLGGILQGLIAMVFFPNVLYSIWISIIFLFGAGMFGAVANVCFPSMTMLMASLLGSASMCVSVDYFVEKLKMANWIWSSSHVKLEDRNQVQFCWYSWAIFGLWPFLFTFGMLVQYFLTAKGMRIRSSDPYKKRQPINRRLSREERAIAKQAKYRYLYQVRTSGGDILSHNFVQSVQNQKSQQLDTLSTHMSTLQTQQTEGSGRSHSIREEREVD